MLDLSRRARGGHDRARRGGALETSQGETDRAMSRMVDPIEALASCVWSEAPVGDDFLAAIIEHVAHPIFVKDRQFRFVVLNRALSELVGVPREKMLGRTDYDFFPKAEADFFRAKDEETMSRGHVVDITEEAITDAHG